MFFPFFRHAFVYRTLATIVLEPAAACPVLPDVSSLQPVTASLSTQFCLFLFCNAFSMFDWLWPSLWHCEETCKADFFRPPCCDYPMVTLPSLFCTCLPSVLLTSLQSPYFSVTSLLHLFCHYPVPSSRLRLMHEQASSPGSPKLHLHHLHLFLNSSHRFPVAFQTSSHQAIVPCITILHLHQ